jgi:ATP-dependent DNA ligase
VWIGTDADFPFRSDLDPHPRSHELKLDGYRIQAHVLEGGATLYTRSGLDWTNRFATDIFGDCRDGR